MKLEASIAPASRKWLDDLPGNFKRDLYEGIKDAMFFAEAESKGSFGKPGNLKVLTGDLRRSIKGESDKDTGTLSSKIIYAAIHEFGGIIRPKASKPLKFKVGGNWKTVREVVMPSRPFLLPAFEDNMDELAEIILKPIMRGIKDE